MNHLQVNNYFKALGCRTSWRVQRGDIEMANNIIASKSLELDEILSKVNGIQFFFSIVTAVETNPKGRKENNSEQDVYPAVAYFIVFRETDTCNENAIFTLFDNEDTHAKIQTITTRDNKGSNTEMKRASRHLFQVVKDRNNRGIVAMFNASNDYYLRNCKANNDLTA